MRRTLDLLAQIVEHRIAPRRRLPPPIGATVGRAALAFAPGDPKSRGEPVEIGRRLRFAGTLQTTPIHPFAEIRLGRADFGDQHDRIGDRLQPSQPFLAGVVDSDMCQGSSCGNGGWMIALDDPGADPRLCSA